MSDEQSDRDAAGTSPGPAVDDGCQFPTGPGGATCGRPIERSGAPGRPSRYCELPEHNRSKAFAARRALDAAGTGPAGFDQEFIAPHRPVTDGRSSFGALLARFEETAAAAQRSAAEQQAQLAAILERATAVVRTVADPDAAGYEVEQIQRETGVRIAEAQTLQADAERLAREQRRAAEHEAELRAQADAAAEDALAQLDALRAETAATLARVAAEHDAAHDELARIRQDTTEQITAARAEADQRIAEREAEMRRGIEAAHTRADERITAADQAIEDARGEARTQILTAQQQAAEAAAAQTRAEAERASAERRATEDRATLDRARAELEQQRADHHDELLATRREAAEERAALRRDASAQLTAILARFEIPGRPPTDPMSPNDPAPDSPAPDSPAASTAAPRRRGAAAAPPADA